MLKCPCTNVKTALQQIQPNINMKTTKQLYEIAEVRMGYNVRGRVEEVADGAVQMLQMKDLNDAVLPADAVLIRTEVGARAESAQIHAGDIIIRTRGASNKTTFIAEEPELPTILASPLMLIRVAEGCRVNPAYLSWLLNQDSTQEMLAGVSAYGTTIPMLNKKTLETLSLEIHPEEQQEQILKIGTLAREIRELTHELADAQHRYVSALLS